MKITVWRTIGFWEAKNGFRLDEFTAYLAEPLPAEGRMMRCEIDTDEYKISNITRHESNNPHCIVRKINRTPANLEMKL